MNIFINIDKRNQKSVNTQEKLLDIAEKLDITVTDIENSDILVSIGGDGTFLKTAKLADKPIVGINTGTLGYLTEINPDNLEKSFKDILNGNYSIENRMMIDGAILKDGGNRCEIPPALNEIAISRKSLGMIRFDAIVDGKRINSYSADGILVSTPTGSTAYNLSCGGPIADPTSEILTLTPIAPHSVINRSIILSKDSTVEIRINEIRNDSSAYVLHDGMPIEISDSDTIRIKKSAKVIKIVKLEDRSFIDTIRENIS